MSRQATRNSFIDEGIDRVQSAFRSAEKEFKTFRRRAEKNRKGFEKQAQKQARRLQKQFRANPIVKKADAFQSDLARQWRKSPIVKRADAFQSDLAKQIESNIESLLGRLSLASQGDIKKIDRKLGQLSRKLRALEAAGEESKSA